MVESRSVRVVLAAKVDAFKADMAAAGKAATDAAQKTETAWDKSSTGPGKAIRAAQQYSSEMQAVGGVMAGFGAVIVGAFGLATKAAISWESSWTGVMKTVEGTPRQLADIESGLRNLAKELPATHEEIAQVAEAAGQLGVATKDVVKFTKTMIDLGESTNLTAEEAATNIAQIMNVMGTSGDEVSKFGSALVQLGNNGASTEKDILSMAQRLAGAGKLVGATEADVLGLANAMASVGIRAELGGGVMSRVMNRMYADVKTGGEGLEDLAGVAGVSSKQFAEAFESDPARAVAMITDGLNGVKDSGGNVIETMKELGIKGTEETSVMLQLAGAGDLLKDSLDMGAEAWELNTALAVESAKRYETAESRIKMSGNTIKDTAITIGGTFAPAVAGAVEAVGGFVGMIGEVPEPVLRMGAALTGVVGASALAGGGFLLLAPRIAETITAVNTLREKSAVLDKTLSAVGANGKTAAALKGIAGAAGAAAGAWALIEVAAASYNAVSPDPAVAGIEDITAALIDSAKEAEATTASIDKIFQAKGGGTLNGDIDSLAAGIDDVMYKGDGFNKFMNEEFLWGVGDKINAHLGLDTTKQQFAEIDQAAASMAESGSAELAAASFSKVAQAFEDGGYKAEQAVELFPELEKQYTAIATAAGETVTETEMFNWMMSGEVPTHVQAAIDATGKGAEGLKGMGDAAKTTEESMSDMLDQMFALGMITLDKREAMRQFEDSIRGVDASIKENGRSLDITTAKGSANQASLDGIADKGFRVAESMAVAGDSQKDIQGELERTRSELIKAAGKFGITGTAAEDLANEVMGIPDGVSVDSWMSSYAEEKAKDTGKEVDKTGKKKAKPKVDADTKGANDKIDATKGKMDKLDKVKATLWVTVKTWWDDLWGGDKPKNESKTDRKGNKSRNPMARFDGAIDLMPMAAGGVHSNIAEMVPPNTWRVVGDRMDVDEAFIPLDGSKRSWKIMMEALTRMPGATPMARGGVLSGSSKADEEQRKLERERLKAIREMQADLRQDLRRGSIRDQVTSGLSGGLSAVDQLSRYGSDENLSRGSRSRATSSARKFESNLNSLYNQAEKIDTKLKKAQDKATELKGIKDSVASGLLNDRDLDVSTSVVSTGDGNFKQVSSMSSMTGKTARLKELVNKLGKLSKMGIPGALLQEVAGQGIEGGNAAADALLGAPIGERNQLVSSWAEFDKYAGQAGQYVTEGFYKGGANAADGVVKGLEGRKKNVESAIANLAKVMESTFKSVLGIHSPSRVMADLGGFTAEGLVQGMLGGVADVQSAASMLGGAAVPALGDMSTSVDVGVNPVVADDEGMAGLAMQDMSTTTLDAMEQMRVGVSDGWAAMLLNMQETQAGMLLGTQTTNAGQLLDTQTQQAAMLLNTQTQNAAMLLDVQTQQEAMRLNVATKQAGQKTVATEQQELMRLMLIDKQSQMKTKSAEDFESLKTTTGLKFSGMRSATDTTMSGMYGDYDTRLGDLKRLNKSGFESILDTSNKNMKGVRDGIDGQMEKAKPELGNRLNSLIGVLSKFTASVNKAFGDVGVKLDAPAALKFADGGVMPGYSPGRDIHHFRSQSAGDLYLSGGEGILRPETTRMIGGEKGIHALNSAARTGNSDALTHMLGGMAFADGGVVPRIPGVNAFADSGVWRNLWAITKEKFPNATLNSAYRGGSITASGNLSHHARGNAIDTSPSMDIFNFWRNTYGSDLAELIYSPANGKQIKNGQNHMYTGAVRGMHFNHVHIAAVKALSEAMAGGLPGMGGAMSHPFLDRAGVKPGDNMAKSYEAAAKKLTEQIYAKHSKMLPDGYMGGLGKGIMSQVSEGLVGKAKDYGKNAGSADFSNVAAGPVKSMAKQMLEQMGMGDQFGDLNWLLTRESGWNPTAQNPTSSAYGLFQFLNGTWGTVGGSKTSDPKMQLEYGLKYIKQRYGDVQGARSFWERNHWYEGGTENAKSGLAVVGERGPELVNFKGGEQVMSTTDSMRFMSANRTYIPHTGGAGFDSKDFATTVASAIKNAQVTPEQIVKTLDGLPLTLMVGDKPMSAYISTTVGSIVVGATRSH